MQLFVMSHSVLISATGIDGRLPVIDSDVLTIVYQSVRSRVVRSRADLECNAILARSAHLQIWNSPRLCCHAFSPGFDGLDLAGCIRGLGD